MLSEASFGVVDYIVCALALSVSLGIGLYYACSGGRQLTSAEYHLGNRNLNFLPVMFSLMVTSQSSILILGVPAEAYLYGFLGTFSGFGFWFAYWLCARIIIPIVHPIRITSINEYFKLRYKNNRVRILTTILSFIFWFIYMGIVTYGVSTAIQSILGLPVWLCVIIVSICSMIYTAVGGIKAVIWTDVIQYCIMLISVLGILIQGSLKVGGGAEVIRINTEGRRLDIWNFSPDPTLRYTLWSVVIGNIAKLSFFPLAQSSVQRIGCMPTMKDAYKMFYFVAPLMCLTFFLAGSMGLVSYAYFVQVQCDPMASKFIKNPNQILPTLVTEIFRDTPGMTGLFIAGLFCATLSTVSSGYAVISSTVLQDVIKLRWKDISEKTSTIASKLTVFFISFLTIGMALLLANIKGTLLKLAQMVMTIPTAPYVGIILYSIFCTSATTAGAITGGLVSLAFYLWMAVGNIVYSPPSVEKKLSPAPIDNCFLNNTLDAFSMSNNVSSTMAQDALEGFNKIYTISFQWFDLIAITLVIVIGLITSKIVGAPKEEDVDPRYVLCFTEQFFPYLPQKVKYILSCRSSIPVRRKQLRAEERQDNEEMVVGVAFIEKEKGSYNEFTNEMNNEKGQSYN